MIRISLAEKTYQVIDILEYACGLKLDPTLTLNQNPIFEMASDMIFVFDKNGSDIIV
jgi:hypothetical protein